MSMSERVYTALSAEQAGIILAALSCWGDEESDSLSERVADCLDVVLGRGCGPLPGGSAEGDQSE